MQAVTVHATNNYFVTASRDNSWCFYELSSGLCLAQVSLLHGIICQLDGNDLLTNIISG